MFELTNNELTMNSREIAELLGSQHVNVRVSIERLANRGVIQLPPTQLVEDKQSLSNNNKTRVYVFSGEKGKRDSIIVVAQLSPEFTARLVDRWQELENHIKSPALPNFNNPVEAARAWADQFEEKQIAYQKLEEAQPKIEFVDKYVDSADLKGFRQVCKILKANESKFREFLLEEKIMYRLNGSLVAYQNHVDANRFDHKTGVAGNGHAFTRALFTAKGVEWVAGQWAKFNLRNAA